MSRPAALLVALLVALPAVPARASEVADGYRPTTLDEHRAQLDGRQVDGHRLAYLDRGQGPAVVMLHGVPTSSFMYREMAAELSGAGLRVIAPDLLGFGSSDKPEDPEAYALGAQALRVLALLDDLGIDRFTLLVHDMGGLVGWEMLAAAPERVERLVILNTFAHEQGWCPPTDLGRSTPLRRLVGRWFADEDRARLLTRAVLAEGLVDRKRCRDPALIEGYHRPIVEGAHRPILAFLSSFDAIRDRLPEMQRALRESGVPALIVWGARDTVLRHRQLVPRLAAELDVPDERIHLLRDGKHFIAEEHAAHIAALVTGFVFAE